VRDWVDTEIMPTYFTKGGQSYVCDAGRRGLHTPTFIIAPIKNLKRAYRKAGLSKNYNAVLAAAKSYDAWQRGAHLFYSGKYNTTQSKYVTSGHEGDSIWADSEGEARLIELVDELREGYSNLSSNKQRDLLANIGCNGCHDMVSAISNIGGMLQEFNIDLRGSLRPSNDEAMKKVDEVRSFFESGLKAQDDEAQSQSLSAAGIFAAAKAYADEGDGDYTTSNMAIEDFTSFDDGSYLLAVRDMDSLTTSIMTVPANTPGKEKLEEGLANLTITYTLQTEFEDDLDYSYTVVDIDYSDMEENVYLVTGTVKSVSTDKMKLVLDLNGVSTFSFNIREEISSIPKKGDYICARYSTSATDLELVDYDELEAPEKLVKVTYLVERVNGSSLLLLASDDDSDSDSGEGYRNYLQIEYGSADVHAMPQEGNMAMVVYHDEVYGETTDADENAIAAASTAAGFPSMSTQSDDDKLNDSATPGYLELGDEYGSLDYGNEVFHVANAIASLDEPVVNPTIPADDENTDDVTIVEKDSASEESSSSKSSSSKSSSSKSSSSKTSASTTPRTGTASTTPKAADPFAGLNGLLSAAAIAGTAMAAYSARRVANEQSKSQDD